MARQVIDDVMVYGAGALSRCRVVVSRRNLGDWGEHDECDRCYERDERDERDKCRGQRASLR